ncbi:DUF3237 domain-containing protein [Ottowia sp.]|uniref:DUF3237 domain-containing protein n=1 Tax=Ottowia sp. TaxID=1898956 RepID=UPI002C835DFD|nr:DUF3237 domain-containing protein [Ottowia sp.]HOB66039.1 DUF3237 domain-containing protein [Ottowia sp.]HPZ56061.1 DUF3237 domain-containing protein [Ottowia sp.]HQD48610.1 DUF3237 domain-containing protein [Ottowia sp.]
MIQTRPLFVMTAEVAPAQVTPDGPYGTRRFIPVTGGRFEGERLRGRMLPGGADCQLIRPDGVAELDVRTTFETDDGVLFLMRGLGLRHGAPEVMARITRGEEVPASDYYFRETMIFEAPRGRYDWLNKLVALGVGERRAATVLLHIHELL